MNQKQISRLGNIGQWLLVLAILTLPFLLSAWYGSLSRLPKQITIATGPEGGQYAKVAQELGRELTHRHGIQVQLLETNGAGSNAIKMANGQATLALYQRGTAGLELSHHGVSVRELMSVGSAYSEVVHWMKRPDHAETTLTQMRGLRIAIGPEHSGSALIAYHLLEEYELLDEVEAVTMPFTELRSAFENKSIDAAMVTLGTEAPILENLLELNDQGEAICHLSSLPFAEAIAARSVFLNLYQIPRGMYDQNNPGAPPLTIDTLAASAQLICHATANSHLIELTTQILNDPAFQRAAGLTELLQHGTEFAQQQLDFPLHPGAEHFYDPQLKPLLNVEFVEATEGIRSFVVSLLIALFFLVKWIRNYQARSQEHQLDRFIRKLLEMERQQKLLDQTDQTDDRLQLQNLLDEVTDLRQQAMKEFSAHDLNTDRATEAFIAMCAALTEKINAKISRQRLDIRLKQLLAALPDSTSNPPPVSAPKSADSDQY
ncbi:MAG: TAXI family TRAP transporter solute-binding subunit [Planctomycetaceae bacterium]|nr:TAXI family TRAP transporter solute-binding subunit [Planctomycetaceae bacterium]